MQVVATTTILDERAMRFAFRFVEVKYYLRILENIFTLLTAPSGPFVHVVYSLNQFFETTKISRSRHAIYCVCCVVHNRLAKTDIWRRSRSASESNCSQNNNCKEHNNRRRRRCRIVVPFYDGHYVSVCLRPMDLKCRITL